MNILDPTVTAVVLAGGASRRLGTDKRRLRLWGDAGPTLLEHTLAVVAPLCAEVVVVLNDASAWPDLKVRTVSDIYSDGGALGGIYSGLQAITTPYALVVACDMPLLNQTLLAAMLAWPRNYDLLVPRHATSTTTRNLAGFEPLHAIYRRTCLEPMRQVLEAGQRRIIDVYPRLDVICIEPAFWQRYDPAGQSLRSLNTPPDLAELQALI
ncbi:molybdenum cofactor guanylyltransferase [Candidatus Chloroploca sp. Khr17]|uniref:molybdenum cofactor guanylyltransferase n=1 Tax=Candidatus Chloroploca sp. Khr17 TaxID=2496869 RepID=UPI00101B6D04|nr:molybdenum cofactor guanylyltransferase [Candidatus Chloroploca sp. Khr17]